jgi:hypothetical protein
MNPSARDIIALFHESGCPIADCKDALIAADNDLVTARQILALWHRGQPTESGGVPSRWNVSNADQSIVHDGQRKCPKCHHQFHALPDVVTCPNCNYCFRSSSLEFPNYFEPFVKRPPEAVAGWFHVNQLQRVRRVFAQMATYGPAAEQESLHQMAEHFGSAHEINLTHLLTTLSAPKLRAIGDLLTAMAAGYDAIDAWLQTWQTP